jgi:hypothetical protein
LEERHLHGLIKEGMGVLLMVIVFLVMNMVIKPWIVGIMEEKNLVGSTMV